MPYGTIKIDTITFTDGGVDKSVPVSGLVLNPTFTGNVTVTGTISGNTIQGGTIVSGLTVTGTTANFASGVFTTQISGVTITSTTVSTTTGNFISLTGTTATITSGIIASGTAALPSLAILSDPNTGIYSPGADQLAISTNGTEKLIVLSDGKVGIGTSSPDANSQLHIVGSGYSPLFVNTTNIGGGGATFFRSGTQALYVGTAGSSWLSGSSTADGLVRAEANLVLASNGNTRAVTIDTLQRVGIGTNAPKDLLSVNGNVGVGEWSGTYGFENASTHKGLQLISSLKPCLNLYAHQASDGDAGEIRFLGLSTSGNPSNYAYIRAIQSSSSSANAAASLAFGTGGSNSPTERARIDSSGRLLVGTSTTASAGGVSAQHAFSHSTSSQWAAAVQHTTAAGNAPLGLVIKYTAATPNNTSSEFLYCEDATAIRAAIRSNGGLANYSANNSNLSDRNAKKDISPAAGTWDCIKEWEIVNYRYKDQPDDANLNLGVIAQQVAESCPEVITVFEEAKDDQPEKLGVKEQQMYWMAIKALQEAQVRIEALEVEVAALKAQ